MKSFSSGKDPSGSCVLNAEREGATERDRQTDIEKDTQTDKERQAEIEMETERWSEREPYPYPSLHQVIS